MLLSLSHRSFLPVPSQPGALLVTADGAVDCSMDPNRQEAICADLHLCEIIAAVGLLAVGGHFMWKGFTLFEHSSVSQLYLMGCLFDKVWDSVPGWQRLGGTSALCRCWGAAQKFALIVAVLPCYVAVGLLAVGGYFMLKGFTLFEHSSVSQLYLIGLLV